MDLEECLKLHGYIEQDEDSGCSEFDEEYERNKPKPLPYDQIKDKIVVLYANKLQTSSLTQIDKCTENDTINEQKPATGSNSKSESSNKLSLDLDSKYISGAKHFVVDDNDNTKNANIENNYDKREDEEYIEKPLDPPNTVNRNIPTTSNTALQHPQPTIEDGNDTLLQNQTGQESDCFVNCLRCCTCVIL